MQPENLLIFSLKEHHLLYKIIIKLSLHLFSLKRNSCLYLNRKSVIWIDSLLIFASRNWFVEIYNFRLLISSRLSAVQVKTAMNASSFVILDCRKSNCNCCLSRLLIGSRTWSKWKSCWSNFIFCKSNLKWKISARNQNLWLIFWFPLFRFYLFFHSWSETETYIELRLR